MAFSTRRACALALLLSVPLFAHASGISVPAGARLDIGGGGISLATQDLRVDGSLTLGNGFLFNVGSLHIDASAQADLGGGLIELLGDWENHGNVLAGTSRVQFLDGVPESAILGSTVFANFSLVSTSGKRYRFESGLTQTVSGELVVQGTAGQAIQIDVTQPGTTGFLNLLASGTQNIASVGVSDVHATGQHLAPTLTNTGGRGNDNGWFGGGGPGPGPGAAVPAPTLSPAGLFLFALALGGLALRARRRITATGDHA
jgi:hypothetical protein